MKTTNTENAITKATESKPTAVRSLKDYIKMYEKEFAKALPSVLTPERFTRMALTAMTTTPKLARCTPSSFMAAMLSAAQLGLEPNTPLGQAYLIPFENKRTGTVTCQFQIGYKGLLDLAYRSEMFKNIDAQVVYENDVFEYELGLEPKLVHKPAMSNRGEPVWYYGVYHLITGGNGFVVMSREDIEKHRNKYSFAHQKGDSPWNSNFDEMAKKTVLKKLLKYAPMKSDFVRGIAKDETAANIDFDDDKNINIIPEDVIDAVDVQEEMTENE